MKPPYPIVGTLSELNVLYQALYMFKFKGDEEHFQEIITSPIFNRLLQRIGDTLHEEFSKIPQTGPKDDDRYIENRPKDITTIKEYLASYEWLSELEEQQKEEVIRGMLSPFQYKEETVNDLMLLLK